MIGLPLAAASLALGAYETFKGAQGLKKLNKEAYPEYSITPEQQGSYNRAQQMATMGYTPQETANFKQNVAQQQNTGFQQGVNMSGGNLAQALATGFKAQNLNAFNSFSASDAALHRNNIRYADQMGQEISNQRNLITGSKIQRRNMLEQAFGGAVRSGLSNMAGSLNLTQAMGQVTPLFGGKGNMNTTGNNAWGGFNTSVNGDAYAGDPNFAPGGDFYGQSNTGGSDAGVDAFYNNTYPASTPLTVTTTHNQFR